MSTPADAPARSSNTVDDRLGRLDPHVPDAHACLRQVGAGRRKQPLHRARIARGNGQRRPGGELAQSLIAAGRHLAEIRHRIELDAGLGQAAQHGGLGVGRDHLRVRAVAVEDSTAIALMASPSGGSVPAGPAGNARCARSPMTTPNSRATPSSAGTATARSCSGSPSARRLTMSSPSLSSSASWCGTSARPSVLTRFSTARSLPVSGERVILKCAISMPRSARAR